MPCPAIDHTVAGFKSDIPAVIPQQSFLTGHCLCDCGVTVTFLLAMQKTRVRLPSIALQGPLVLIDRLGATNWTLQICPCGGTADTLVLETRASA
jgi:hypothetical protein